MRGETMPERVAGHFFLDVGPFGGTFHAALDLGRIDMMTADAVRDGVCAESVRRKHILPFERPICLLVFQMEGVRKGDVPMALGNILFVEKFHLPAVIRQVGDQRFGKNGISIFLSFAGPDANLFIGEIDVLNAEAEGFVKAESGAIEQLHEEFFSAGQIDDDGRNLLLGEHGGESLRTLGKLQILKPRKILLDHIPIEEQNGAHRLILCGCGYVSNRCEMIQIIDHLLFA